MAIDFPNAPNRGDEFIVGSVTWTWDGVKWTAYPGALAIPDAPNDSQTYGRKNVSGTMSWAVIGSGGITTDAPSDGTMYGRKSAGWSHLTHSDISDWTATLANYALTSSVPLAYTVTPAMDGTAAVGTSAAFARGDHVHPTDTSRYSASNPAGYQTAANVNGTLASYLLLAGGAMTGPIKSVSGDNIDGAAGTNRGLFGMTAGSTRWQLALGNLTAEATGNVGSDFALTRYDNTGNPIDSPIIITRTDGRMLLTVDPNAPLGAATKQYVDAVNLDCGTF